MNIFKNEKDVFEGAMSNDSFLNKNLTYSNLLLINMRLLIVRCKKRLSKENNYIFS